jgi:hypothetical protein
MEQERIAKTFGKLDFNFVNCYNPQSRQVVLELNSQVLKEIITRLEE